MKYSTELLGSQRLAISLIVVQMMIASIAFGVTTKENSEADGLAEISQVRRTLRSACAKIKMIEAQANNTDDLLHEADAEIARALADWRTFHTKQEKGAPLAYATHPAWRETAKAIETKMQQMALATANRDAKTAFSSCGQACGLFVEMNEKAGIELSTDVLFRFRKTAKTMLDPAGGGRIVIAEPAVRKLLDLKEKVLVQPLDGSGMPVLEADALTRFSQAVDAFALAARETENTAIDVRYREMMSSMEAAYDRYL